MVMQTVFDILQRKLNLYGQRVFRLLLRLKCVRACMRACVSA